MTYKQETACFFAAIYIVVLMVQVLAGMGDQYMDELDKKMMRIEYLFPGYRLGRVVEKPADPLFRWLFGRAS